MFNEENTVEQMVFDTLCGGETSNVAAQDRAYHAGASTRNQRGLLHGI